MRQGTEVRFSGAVDATPHTRGSTAGPSVQREALEALAAMVRRGNVVVLTGAGMSTDSGIPDYRGPDGKRRVTPMTYGEFVTSAPGRQRYWARSYVGWRRFRSARPNVSHHAVAELERRGLSRTVITQNVDELHQKAGAREVIELHGTLDRVVCLTCGEAYRRDDIQAWLTEANPGFDQAAGGSIRPDGDVDLPPEAIDGFRAPRCLLCGEDQLKPDVVFFGESVPKPLVAQCFDHVEQCSGVLVLGSSLAVMSGYRFVRRAHRLGIPVAIVTRGWSRGDGEATVRLDAPLGETLTGLLELV
ncbi:MAG TPA: NAD-dependent protein deacetylase [Segeticoccus sp.]|uniref:NAD-dependent protein deacetylase n=1 Tax=Segeticoccus sp. TaxID=2706531 RepID=UPI002D808AA1|nr:NAD-dependent protein deacetylase [Segeticoccus sp.]HET8600384.1 NAD-dependent protein deacetylase [Segeticoccus sp.]